MNSLKISKLVVTNFRNLKPDIYEFNQGINCILGENGNGKTNLLEAIYFLITHKSFRKNTQFPQIVSIDSDEPTIIFNSTFNQEAEVVSYSGKVYPKKQDWYLDSKPYKKKLLGTPVFINPYDAYQFFMQTSSRRDFFDTYFSSLSEAYEKSIKDYRKFLKQRNSLLSNYNEHSKLQLKALDQNFSICCFNLLNLRLNLAEEFEKYIPKVFNQIFSEDHQIGLKVESRWLGFSAEEIFNYLQENSKLEFLMGHTKYSIHKDDYTLLFDGFKASEFCSLGQQKMSYLSLLFAYIELFRYKFKTFPLVLLDDLSGELDEARWKKLVLYLKQQKFQVLISSANEKFREELDSLSNAKNFLIKSGSLVQGN